MEIGQPCIELEIVLNPKQDKNGVIHFIDPRNITEDEGFMEEWICHSCNGEAIIGDECTEYPGGTHCLRRELFRKVDSAVYLLNAAITDLYFGLWRGLYETEMKKQYDRDNNS